MYQVLKYAPDLEYISRWIHKLPSSTLILHSFRANYAFLMKLPNFNNFFSAPQMFALYFLLLWNWSLQDSVSCILRSHGSLENMNVRTTTYINSACIALSLPLFYMNWTNCLIAQFSVRMWKVLGGVKVRKTWVLFTSFLYIYNRSNAISPPLAFLKCGCDGEASYIREVRAI